MRRFRKLFTERPLQDLTFLPGQGSVVSGLCLCGEILFHCLRVSADLGVHIQVENIDQSHQIVKNSDDVSGQIDVTIRKARLSQLFQILIDDLGGCQRDLFGELQ